jgi:fermentation-respiration switch protein FrsA (DUF1100 family)
MPAILFAALIPALGLAALGIYFARKLICQQIYTTSHTIEDGIAKGEFSRSFVESPKEEFSIRSQFGYVIKGFTLKGSTNRTVIFCHGVTWTLWGMAKYMHSFVEKGWNIVAYDSRGHGESGGGRPSYGFYEKHDLKSVEDWTISRFPETEKLGLFGESMGASTVLQFAPMSTHTDFMILDSPYSDLTELCRTRLAWAGVPGVFIPAVLFFAGLYIRAAEGFSLSDVSPQNGLARTSIPAMFFHGNDDEQVPVSMSVKMHEEYGKRAFSRIALFNGALHSRSVAVDEKHYLSELWIFMGELGLD